MEIGYGNGYLISLLYKKLHSKIYGIDIASDMKNAATKRNGQGVNTGDINLVVGDCCSLSFENDLFENIVTVNTIYFWPDTIKGLSEIFRVLKSDGIFINAVYSKEWMEHNEKLNTNKKRFTREKYIRDGRKAGFQLCYIVIRRNKK